MLHSLLSSYGRLSTTMFLERIYSSVCICVANVSDDQCSLCIFFVIYRNFELRPKKEIVNREIYHERIYT